MLSTEQGVIPGSDFYIHTPSVQASVMFLYPVSTDYLHHLPGYCLRRSSYDSSLIMYMQKGSCEIETEGRICHAGPDQTTLLDCYEPYCYYTTTGQDTEWLHFDGSNARSYFKAITDSGNLVVNLHDMYRFEKYLHKIYTGFKDHTSIREASPNSYIVNILTELLIGHDMGHSVNVSTSIIEDTAAYTNGYLVDPLMLEELASQASLSSFYSSRSSKKETGPVLHGYVITARVNNARLLLKSPNATTKEICFGIGFTSESSLCITFKKITGSTPFEYQERICQ